MSTLNQDLEEAGLYTGRIISGNKVGPKGHLCFFNACIFDQDLIQSWYGDIDLTKDRPILEKVAHDRQQVLYVTREYPFRFDGLKKKDIKKPDLERIAVFAPTYVEPR